MQKAIPTSLRMPSLESGGGMYAATQSLSSLGNAGTAITTADIGVKLDSIVGILVQMFPALLEAFNVRVVLDDGTLVGRLAPEIDKSLGLLQRQRAVLGV
jgi:hypothetical protein